METDSLGVVLGEAPQSSRGSAEAGAASLSHKYYKLFTISHSRMLSLLAQWNKGAESGATDVNDVAKILAWTRESATATFCSCSDLLRCTISARRTP